MWHIDKDYINVEDDISHSRVGTEGNTWHDMFDTHRLPITDAETRFRLRDDDGIIYYGGWLHNDDECQNQEMALEYGKYDAGCTTIEVKLNGEWVQEIG